MRLMYFLFTLEKFCQINLLNEINFCDHVPGKITIPLLLILRKELLLYAAFKL